MDNITKFSQPGSIIEDIYSKFFAKSKGFDGVDIVCNNKNKHGKATSFSFKSVSGETPMNILERVFGISKKKMAMGLVGGIVDFRILTLHSSALLALLVFYKVGEKNKLTIDGVIYNDVLFEVKNEVVGGGPSRVDVLLISKDEKTLLFLESKFTEPLNRGKVTDLSEAYEKYYKKIKFDEIKGSDGIGLEYIQDPKDQTFTIKKKNTRNTNQYCAGIKQMISHFIGLCKGPAESENKTYREIFDKADNLILGEILFDFPDEQDYDEMRTMINDYKTLYEGLVKFLKKEEFLKVEGITNDKEIAVLENALTYQRVLEENPVYKNKLDARVRDFYHF